MTMDYFEVPYSEEVSKAALIKAWKVACGEDWPGERHDRYRNQYQKEIFEMPVVIAGSSLKYTLIRFFYCNPNYSKMMLLSEVINISGDSTIIELTDNEAKDLREHYMKNY